MLKKDYTRTNKINYFNVLSLVLSILILLSFVISFNFSDNIFLEGSAFSYILNKEGNSISLFDAMCWLMLISGVWCLVNSILHLSSIKLDQGLYGFFSKISSVIMLSITVILLVMVFISFILSSYTYALFFVHVIIFVAALIFEIFKLVLHVKNNR